MQTYYVIWRGDEDDFMLTALDLEAAFFATLSNNQIIKMCYDAEYLSLEDSEPNPYSDEAGGAPYDLIDIITGTDVQCVGST